MCLRQNMRSIHGNVSGSSCMLSETTFCSFFSTSPCSLINADFCCAGSLIAYGALLGKVSPVQLMVVTLFGITLFAVEEFIILDLLHVSLRRRKSSFTEHRDV